MELVSGQPLPACKSVCLGMEAGDLGSAGDLESKDDDTDSDSQRRVGDAGRATIDVGGAHRHGLPAVSGAGKEGTGSG